MVVLQIKIMEDLKIFGLYFGNLMALAFSVSEVNEVLKDACNGSDFNIYYNTNL